jgi:ABC-2 type transport system permease protein
MDHKTVLILTHEFAQTVRRTGFIIMTLAFPVLAVLGLVVYQLVSGISRAPSTSETVSIGYVDGTGVFTKYMEQPGASLVKYDGEDLAKRALLDGKVKEYIVIPSDYLAKGMIARYSLDQEVEMSDKVASALRSFVLDNLLDGQSAEMRARVVEPLSVTTVRLDKTGNIATNQGGFGAFIVPYLLAVLLVMAIFSSSGFLLQGLTEEKQNRVMEVLLSSVSPRQLLTGKVLGLGAAGLVQIVVWLATIAVLAPVFSTTIGGFLSNLSVPLGVLCLGLLYFILGYLFFAMIMAGVGAVSTTPQESQQLSSLFTLMAVVPLWAGGFIIQNPGHVVTLVLTLFPFTAPITLMTRLGLTQVPPWEIVASVAILMLSTVGALFVAAKVLRAFLLMYGKRPDLKQIIRVLREA